MRQTVIRTTAALAMGGCLLGLSERLEPVTEAPAGVEMLLPRGRIAAIFEPRFVDVDAAKIADDAIVLGVAIGDEAHAYSLNLLNSHEVVNDQMAGTSFAAVW